MKKAKKENTRVIFTDTVVDHYGIKHTVTLEYHDDNDGYGNYYAEYKARVDGYMIDSQPAKDGIAKNQNTVERLVRYAKSVAIGDTRPAYCPTLDHIWK